MPSRWVRFQVLIISWLALSFSPLVAVPGQREPEAGKPRAAAADPGPRFVSLTIGETTLIKGTPDMVERVIFPLPAGLDAREVGRWEFSPDVAIKLGRLKDEKQKIERWRVIRRNLNLAPDDKTDWVIWKEIIDAIFDQIGNVPLPPSVPEEKEPPFGLRVSFPGKDAAGKAAAQVELTFNSDRIAKTGSRNEKNDFERGLKGEIAAVMTGIEGLVRYVDERNKAIPLAEAREKGYLAGTRIRLRLNSSRPPLEAIPDDHGYYVFPSLPVDRDFGSEYELDVATGKTAGDAAGPDFQIALVRSRTRSVPVRYGARTMVETLELRKTPRPAETDTLMRKNEAALGFAGMPAQAALLLTKFLESNALLEILSQRLPPNPGLHFGYLSTPDDGWQPLWSIRLRFRPEGFDRSPRFVSRGTIRLQAFAAEEKYYLKITWFSRVDAAALDLQSRPVVESPWGLGVGVVPSLSPALYTAGLSFKPISPVEFYAGAGKQKGKRESIVFGATLDVNALLDLIFGKEEGSGADSLLRTEESPTREAGSAPAEKSPAAPPRKK